MICPKCGTDAAGYTYCPQCGEEVVSKETCARCGTNTHGCRFCPSCGEKVPKTTLCKNCGADTKGFNFCPNCGQEVYRPKTCTNCGADVKDHTYCPNCGVLVKEMNYNGSYEARLTPSRTPGHKKRRVPATKPAPNYAPVVAPENVAPAEPEVTVLNDAPVDVSTEPDAQTHFRKFTISAGIANVLTCLAYAVFVYLTKNEDMVLAYSGITVFVLTFVLLPLSRVRKTWTLPLYSVITGIHFISMGFKIAVMMSHYFF